MVNMVLRRLKAGRVGDHSVGRVPASQMLSEGCVAPRADPAVDIPAVTQGPGFWATSIVVYHRLRLSGYRCVCVTVSTGEGARRGHTVLPGWRLTKRRNPMTVSDCFVTEYQFWGSCG
jgi:hypothetical protein